MIAFNKNNNAGHHRVLIENRPTIQTITSNELHNAQVAGRRQNHQFRRKRKKLLFNCTYGNGS